MRLGGLLLVLPLLMLSARPAAAWTQYRTLSPGVDGAPRGCGLRWPTSQVQIAMDDGTLDGLTSVDVQAIGVQSGNTWRDVQCTLCQTCRAGHEEPQSCGANPLGMDLLWHTRGKPTTIGATCVSSQSDGSCNSVTGNGNWVNFVHDQKTWEDQGVSSLVVALTVLTYDRNSGEIRDADVLLDDWSHDFCVAPDCGGSRYDLEGTLTHELGHLLGLDHSTNPEATMFAGAAPGETAKRSLDVDDVTGICTAYRTSCNDCADANSSSTCQAAASRSGWLALASLGLLLGVWAVIRRARN
jgi:hypothetical protein